jgi:hypothetical protein
MAVDPRLGVDLQEPRAPRKSQQFRFEDGRVRELLWIVSELTTRE